MIIWKAEEQTDEFYRDVLTAQMPHGDPEHTVGAFLHRRDEDEMETLLALALGEVGILDNYDVLDEENFIYDPWQLHAILGEAESRRKRLFPDA